MLCYIEIQVCYFQWPFARVFGMQEPASVLFSLLNAAAHLYSIVQFRRRVIPLSPMYGVWHGFSLVGYFLYRCVDENAYWYILS